MTDRSQDATEPLAAVPVSELRKLAEVLSGMDIELADDYVAGLANRLLRDLARRWADTVRVWAVEAELWGAEPDRPRSPGVGGAAGALPPDELALFLREAVSRVASATGRSPLDVVGELAAHFAGDETGGTASGGSAAGGA
jgi:hypothetical protein